MSLSNKIRAFRFKNGELTQKELAERVGVSRQTLNAIENALRAPTIDVAIRIADIFGVAVDDLFDLEDEGRPVRREKSTTIAAKRPETTVQESVDVASRDKPAKKEAEKKITFASLRKVIGP